MYDNNGSQTGERFRRAFTMRRSATGAADFQSPNFALGKSNTERAMQMQARGINYSPVPYTNQEWFTVTVKVSGTGGALKVNDVSPVTSSSNSAPDNMRYLRIGDVSWSTGNPPASTYGGDLASNWQGYFAEIVMFNTELSDANIALIKSYLNTKWGLT